MVRTPGSVDRFANTPTYPSAGGDGRASPKTSCLHNVGDSERQLVGQICPREGGGVVLESTICVFLVGQVCPHGTALGSSLGRSGTCLTKSAHVGSFTGTKELPPIRLSRVKRLRWPWGTGRIESKSLVIHELKKMERAVMVCSQRFCVFLVQAGVSWIWSPDSGVG